MKGNLLILSIFISVFSLFLLSNLVFATNFLDSYAVAVVQTGGNITISGGIYNTSNSSQGMPSINVTAYVNFPVSGNLSNVATGAGGAISNFNISAPTTVGNYSVTIYTNDSTTNNKTIPIYVTNISGGSITYTGKYPPFSNGTSFTINVTLLNGTTKIANYAPNVSIYVANGQQASWNIANQSLRSDSGGVISYNITIPSTASPGQYAVVVEKGMIVNVFSIQTGYIVSVNTETPSAETSSNFAPNSQVMILAKVKTSAGDATSATSVTAYVTLPNGTVRTVSLTARDQTAYPGYYNNTFSEANASGLYQVRADATVGGSTTSGYTIFNTKTFTARLEPQTDFFMEWGGSSAFGAGQTIGLNVAAVNLSTDDIITVGTGASKIPTCDATYLTFDKVFFTNGTNATVTNVQFTTGQYMMNTICRIQFTGPSASGVYGVRVNLTIGGVTQTAEGYFSIQKYFLKPALVAGLGGEMEFMKLVSPGENVTITLSAYNVTSNAGVGGGNITNVNVTKIIPLMFTQGITEYTNLTVNQNYTVSLSSAPTVTLTIPSTILGPTSVEIQAVVSGETVRGSLFFMSNYLEGFLGPGGGGGPGGSPFMSCSGNVTLTGSVKEVKTMQAVQTGSVIANSLHEASEESTGKNVMNYITLSANGTSGQNGQISVNLTFSPSYSFSGFYFVVINATYQGKVTGIPAGFMCKSLNYWPQIKSVGGTEMSWRIAPTSNVTITITNVTFLSNSSKIVGGTLTIPRIMNFNPAKGGMKLYIWNSTTGNLTNYLNYSGTGQNVQNNITLILSPSSFTDGTNPLQKWPNGFVDFQPTVCTLDNSVCDTNFGGFQVVPFDAWLEGFSWGGSLSVNSSQSYSLFVKTNVSRSNYDTVTSMNSTNNTAFEVLIGRPWEGELTNVSISSAVLVSDGWNSQSDFGGERWTVNFTIPATMSKGETQISISVKGYNNETASVDAWATLTKYSIVIPNEEGIQEWWGMDASNPGGAAFFTATGINMTAVNQLYGISSKSGLVQNHTGFISTRYVQDQQQTIIYDPTVKMLLIDRTTANVYDTLVFNRSGTVGYVNETNRTLTLNMGLAAGVYLRSIEGMYVKIINVSSQALPSGGNWGGSAQINANMTIPYVVRLGNSPLPNAGVHANGIAKQLDQGGSGEGGFGFESRLTEGTNYTYTSGTTDSLGVAFLKVNVSNSGKFNVFWKVNTSSDSDIASMSTGTNVEFRAFDSYSQPTFWLPQGKVVLAWSNNTIAGGGPIWNAFNPVTVTDVYNGSITETNGSYFIRDNVTSTWYVVYTPITNQTAIDDDKTNMTSTNDTNDYNVLNGNWNSTISVATTWANGTATDASQNQQIAVGTTSRNTSYGAGSTMTLTFYQDNPRPSSYSLSSANENISVVACARTFDVPNRKPIENATVRLFTQEWSMMGPSTNRWLTLYSPLDDSVALAGGGTDATPPTSNVITGPQGCVAFKAIYTQGGVNGWQFGCSQVQGTITRGSDVENIWVGQVCR